MKPLTKQPSRSDRFAKHVHHWQACILCPLHLGRKTVVLSRGDIPCEVLFYGEAPGESEDALGVPFKGPAGDTLNNMLTATWKEVGRTPHCAFTNTVACIPWNEKEDEESKTRVPNKKEIAACRPRVVDYIKLSNPKLIVSLGKVPAANIPPENFIMEIPKLQLIHPSALLRMSTGQANECFKRFVLTLAQAVRNL